MLRRHHDDKIDVIWVRFGSYEAAVQQEFQDQLACFGLHEKFFKLRPQLRTPVTALKYSKSRLDLV